MKIMKCNKCNVEMRTSEGWIEFNEEMRHAEYYICPKCHSIHNYFGDKLVDASGELQLTFPKK